MNLKSEQRRLYGLLPAGARCFVRICADDRAMWVSDLPRRMPECEALKAELQREGFAVCADDEARLWYVDWTKQRWMDILSALPETVPPLPTLEKDHGVYALCRLWLAHPAPLAEETMPALRRVCKLTADAPDQMRRAVRALHEEAAVQLRCGKPVAHAAGWVLAAWLLEHADGKETRT